MKVIFLDIDGVLNCDTSKSYCGMYVGVDADKIRRLARIVEETGAKIVLSSDWRDGWYKAGTQSRLAKYLNRKLWKIGKLIISDKTRQSDRFSVFERACEIEDYLEAHPDIECYVVLDDNMFDDFYDNPVIEKRLVLTDCKVGLTDDDADKAIKILCEK